MAAGTIPDEVLRARKSGSVAVRYDVIAGKAQNLTVVSSSPAGLYDAYVLKHAGRYTDARGTTVRGCVMTIDIKF